MKGTVSVILLGLVSLLPFRDARLVSFPKNSDTAPKVDVSFPAIIITETVLYEKYVCVGNDDGLRLLVPGSCVNYYECFNGVATVNACGSLTPYFDSINQSCVAESSCVERNIEVSTGPAGCLGVCCGKTAGLYVDSSDNTKFYFCNNNVGILHSCCSGEQFNPITKACDVPANCQ